MGMGWGWKLMNGMERWGKSGNVTIDLSHLVAR